MDSPTVPTPAPSGSVRARVACPPVTRIPGERRDPIPPAIRAAVYQRDGRTCQECGAGPLITFTQRVGKLSAAPYITLDHVTEWGAGGCDHEHNLRVLCSTCNSRRSNIGPQAADRRSAAIAASAAKRREARP